MLKWRKRVFYSTYIFGRKKSPILNNLKLVVRILPDLLGSGLNSASEIDHILPGFTPWSRLERMCLIFVKVLLYLVEKVLSGVFL